MSAQLFTHHSQRLALLMAASCAGLTGCAVESSSESSDNPTETTPGAADEEVTLEYVTATARAASYISFDYSADGCHDRSILIGAELAAASIPSNALFIVPSGDSAVLTPRQHPGLEWNYHVAPVVHLPEFGPPEENKVLTIEGGVIVGDVHPGAYVVDPSLYPEEIVAPVATWVADLTGEGQSGFLAVYDAREALGVPNTIDDAIDGIATTIPTTVENMPKFWQFQLGGSCGFLSRDAGNLESEIGADGVEAIRRQMNAGVTALLELMLAEDLLLEKEPIPEFPCWDF